MQEFEPTHMIAHSTTVPRDPRWTRTEVTTKKDDRGTSAGTLCKLCNPYAFSSKTTLRRIYQNTKITQAINHSYFSLHRDQTTARIGFQVSSEMTQHWESHSIWRVHSFISSASDKWRTQVCSLLRPDPRSNGRKDTTRRIDHMSAPFYHQKRCHCRTSDAGINVLLYQMMKAHMWGQCRITNRSSLCNYMYALDRVGKML
jgi:hypothetical protein